MIGSIIKVPNRQKVKLSNECSARNNGLHFRHTGFKSHGELPLFSLSSQLKSEILQFENEPRASYDLDPEESIDWL